VVENLPSISNILAGSPKVGGEKRKGKEVLIKTRKERKEGKRKG
jgi:hypothetical protein